MAMAAPRLTAQQVRGLIRRATLPLSQTLGAALFLTPVRAVC
jgi:hypothetical protein